MSVATSGGTRVGRGVASPANWVHCARC